MGAYYKHTKNVSINIPYSFCCEQCGQDSGELTATIAAKAELNSNFKNLNPNQQQKLDNQAYANLKSAVKTAHKNAVEKQQYDAAFRDACPHCAKPQSWAISGMQDNLLSTPIVCVILGIIIGLGCYFFANVENPLRIAMIAAGICVAVGVVIFLYNLLKLNKKKKQVSTATQMNLPTVEWSAVQNLLDEA